MDTANRTLNALDVDNAVVVEGKLAEGYRKQAPYDVIVFQGSVAEVPEAVKRQLADGGRLVAVVLDDAGIGRGTMVQRAGDKIGRAHVCTPVTNAPLVCRLLLENKTKPQHSITMTQDRLR